MIENLVEGEGCSESLAAQSWVGTENIVSFLDALDKFKKEGAGIVGLAKYFSGAGLSIDYDSTHQSSDASRTYVSVALTVNGELGDGTVIDLILRQTDSFRQCKNYRQSVGVSGLIDSDAMPILESWDLASSRRSGREGSGLHILKPGYDQVNGSEHYQTFIRHEQRC